MTNVSPESWLTPFSWTELTPRVARCLGQTSLSGLLVKSTTMPNYCGENICNKYECYDKSSRINSWFRIWCKSIIIGNRDSLWNMLQYTYSVYGSEIRSYNVFGVKFLFEYCFVGNHICILETYFHWYLNNFNF